MARNRKNKTNTQPPSQEIEIPEDEQWRLIRESGILEKARPSSIAPQRSELEEDVEEGMPQLCNEILDAMIYVIPTNFLLLMMEILIHYQYGRRPSLEALWDRMVPSIPILSVFIFYTTRHKRHRRTQFFLFTLATVVGPRMIYLLNRASWTVNMQQCPPLATVWVYCIVQLDLGPAALNLLVVGIFVWLKGLKLSF
ncbi:hypothetical protein BDN72DRAFT_831432 [Pluteus cervinus]|uniref:Uncharacterized protein n=1 Tax=Pluteus cervinus TaxID=181527 RepID=A0ACD3BEG5_9AGAR|nr:hypothetical protein BDN72DRAFT_831432 [Pluteus cervinus]